VVSISTASSRAQGTVLALAVARVALALGGEHVVDVLVVLGGAAPRALFGAGGEEDLQRGVGLTSGADVAALGDVVA